MGGWVDRIDRWIGWVDWFDRGRGWVGGWLSYLHEADGIHTSGLTMNGSHSGFFGYGCVLLSHVLQGLFVNR